MFLMPFSGVAGTKGYPKPEAFEVEERGGRVGRRCPLCRRKGWGGWGERHAKQEHELCECGRWFVSIGMHRGAVRRYGTVHRAILTR